MVSPITSSRAISTVFCYDITYTANWHQKGLISNDGKLGVRYPLATAITTSSCDVQYSLRRDPEARGLNPSSISLVIIPQPSRTSISSSTTAASIHYCWTHRQNLCFIMQDGRKREEVSTGAHTSLTRPSLLPMIHLYKLCKISLQNHPTRYLSSNNKNLRNVLCRMSRTLVTRTLRQPKPFDNSGCLDAFRYLFKQ